jgi:Family of unknown function (DUF5989)
MSAIVSGKIGGSRKLARWTDRVTSPFRTLQEFTQLATRSGRGWWLIPMMASLLLLGVLIATIQVIEYVAPFVYTIF